MANPFRVRETDPLKRGETLIACSLRLASASALASRRTLGHPPIVSVRTSNLGQA